MPVTLDELLLDADAKTVLQDLDLGSNAATEQLAECAARLIGYDAAAVLLYDQGKVQNAGAFGIPWECWPRAVFDRVILHRAAFIAEFDLFYPESQLANGQIESFKSAIVARISFEDEVIGGLWLYSRTRQSAPSEAQLEAIVELAFIAGEMIRKRADLKLMLANVFSVINK